MGAFRLYLLVPGSSRELPGSAHAWSNGSGGWVAGSMSAATEQQQSAATGRGFDLDAWIPPLCALVVAAVAAYAAYVHQRAFARQGGADRGSTCVAALGGFFVKETR
jgi:hypothetical protein